MFLFFPYDRTLFLSSKSKNSVRRHCYYLLAEATVVKFTAVKNYRAGTSNKKLPLRGT